MINITENSSVYVFCPQNKETGGTELAHQLVDYLRNKSLDAYIVYIDLSKNTIVEKALVPSSFIKYNIEVEYNVIDSFQNILVLPEIFFSLTENFQSLQFVFWWMSVEHYYRNSDIREIFCHYTKDPYFLGKQIYNRILNKKPIFNNVSLNRLKKFEDRSIHAYQSVYAQDCLIKRGIDHILPLSDYINLDFIKNKKIERKENIVLYNPAKGLNFTKKIIEKLPHIKFIALKGFSREELNEYFSIAKLYIDFGSHPGKDRLPREAAINNCCIITGRDGSSNYFQDIPISSKYKFRKRNNNISHIVKQIECVLSNYNDVISDFNFYKNRILKEEGVFYREIDDIFQVSK